MIQNKTILVTGGAGFIGFWLSERLLNEGWQVVGVDNINNYYDVRLKYARLGELGISESEVQWNKLLSSSKHEGYRFIRMKMEDGESMAALFDEISFGVVCNLGAQAGVRYSIENPMAYVSSNIVGFTNILEQSQKHKVEHLVYASSSSVYGLNGHMPFTTHESVNHPVSFYAATKKSNELMAHVFSKLYQLPTTGLRFFTVYGPWGRPDMSPMLFADAIMHGKPLKVFNNGDMGRDFTYIGDIIEGVMRVIYRPATAAEDWDAQAPDPATSSEPYRIYNIGSSSPVRLMDYIETLEQALGKKAVKEFLPMQPGDVLNTYCAVSDLEKEFGY
ncbi:MAG: NAD-dependent epimerase/dehydratase family protein, partial [Bacteroidia bacterium]|nr:NAD-dependent epimerase/dehydratase family protein [Bacteroidia bacterium]